MIDKNVTRITKFSNYPQAFLLMKPIVGVAEGGFQKLHGDKGNWTGGQIGAGTLVGTNFGISAAAYPKLDIPNITKAEATEIFFQDYYEASGIPLLNPDCPSHFAFATAMFDCAVLNGRGNATRFLQRCLGLADDGQRGPLTEKAMADRFAPQSRQSGVYEMLGEFQQHRLEMMRKLSSWGQFGGGWSIRLAMLTPRALAAFHKANEGDGFEPEKGAPADTQGAPLRPIKSELAFREELRGWMEDVGRRLGIGLPPG